MNSVLIELIGTLYVGGLAIALLAAGFWAIRGSAKGFRKWFQEANLLSSQTSLAFPLALACFGIGVFVEGITDWMTDSESYKGIPVSALQRQVLGTEGELRANSLFRRNDEGNYSLRRLGLFVFEDRSLVRKVTGSAEFASDPSAFMNSQHDRAIEHINQLYYQAKNWCYSQNNYFLELEHLQRRIDWSRSSFLIMSGGALVAFGWMVVVAVALGMLNLTRLADPILVSVGLHLPKVRVLQERVKNYLRLSLKRLLFVGFFAVPASWMCVETYKQSEEQFNERAFGYYMSSLLELDIRAPRTPEGQTMRGEQMLGAVVWMQTAAEYRAVCLTVYRAAGDAITAAVRKKRFRRPPAVVLDLDETVLDNTTYNSDLALAGEEYSEHSWRQWSVGRADEVRLVPGAKEFLERMDSAEVIPVFISNRKENELEATLRTMNRLGLGERNDLKRRMFFSGPMDVGKQSRRERVAAQYEIVGLIGDSLGDFAEDFDLIPGETVATRWEDVDNDHSDRPWGSLWFALPNPAYGDWTRVVDWTRPWQYSSKPIRGK